MPEPVPNRSVALETQIVRPVRLHTAAAVPVLRSALRTPATEPIPHGHGWSHSAGPESVMEMNERGQNARTEESCAREVAGMPLLIANVRLCRWWRSVGEAVLLHPFTRIGDADA